MTWTTITGLWSKNDKAPGFKMTQKIRQAFSDVPDGVYVNYYPNEHKGDDPLKPDFKLSYKTPDNPDHN